MSPTDPHQPSAPHQPTAAVDRQQFAWALAEPGLAHLVMPIRP